MKQVFRFIGSIWLVLAFAVLASSDVVAQSQQGPIDARVLVIDASGTMAREDYDLSEGSRWNEAMALVEAYFSQLEERNDAIPTEVLIFGAETYFLGALSKEMRKQAGQRQFTNSLNYPIDGPLCQDIRFVTSGFEVPTKKTWKTVKNYVNDLPGRKPPGGMTPQGPAFNMALDRLIAKYGTDVNAEIVAFSDFESPNCAPRDQTVCDQILPNLNLLKSNGGRAEMRILGIPSTNLVGDLLKCVPVKEVVHDPDPKITPDDTIDDLLGDLRVTASVRSTTPGLLNAGTIDLNGLTFTAHKSGKPAVAAGGPAQNGLAVAAGVYDFVLSRGSDTWRVTQDIQNDQEIVFLVDAGRVLLSAARNGTAISQLDAVEIRDATGRNVAPSGGAALSAEFVLMAGQYELTGQESGETKSLPVTVSFGATTPVALAFSKVGTKTRPVSIELDIRQPTLDVVDFNPQIELSGGGTTPVVLSNQRNALSLEAGSYTVSVGRTRQHNLSFQVPNGVAPMDVRVVVTPGWFEATAPVSGGSFEVLDASGAPIATLTGDRVRHSIADGTYTLVHVSSDGVRRPSAMHITAGDLTRVRF